jgi:hypothetical protein
MIEDQDESVAGRPRSPEAATDDLPEDEGRQRTQLASPDEIADEVGELRDTDADVAVAGDISEGPGVNLRPDLVLVAVENEGDLVREERQARGRNTFLGLTTV